MAYQVDLAQTLADQIFNEFDRLGVSTNQYALSGLMVSVTNTFLESDPEKPIVKVEGLSTNGMYDAIGLLKTLESEEKINHNTIWDFIRDCKV